MMINYLNKIHLQKELESMDKINYYLYHIPGKKIGVTRDLISRVVDQQGYSLDEVEVLEQSTDIDYISCLLYTSPSPRDRQKSRMPSSA